MDEKIVETRLNLDQKTYGINSTIFKIVSPHKNKVYIGYSGYGIEYIIKIYDEMVKKFNSGKYFQNKSFYDLLNNGGRFEIIENNNQYLIDNLHNNIEIIHCKKMCNHIILLFYTTAIGYCVFVI